MRRTQRRASCSLLSLGLLILFGGFRLGDDTSDLQHPTHQFTGLGDTVDMLGPLRRHEARVMPRHEAHGDERLDAWNPHVPGAPEDLLVGPASCDVPRLWRTTTRP